VINELLIKSGQFLVKIISLFAPKYGSAVPHLKYFKARKSKNPCVFSSQNAYIIQADHATPCCRLLPRPSEE
jgi:hypothetical protein